MKHTLAIGVFSVALAVLWWTPRSAAEEGEGTTEAAVPKNPAMRRIQDVAGLPRVLLIGDSISIGYTLPVRKLLDGKANVHRIPANGQTSANGLQKLDAWLGKGKWDVIHFNFGLHDAKYASADQTKVPRDQYEANLRELVKRLKQTGAKLVWATTTPVPGELEPPGRRFDDVVAYNAIAAKVMNDNGVAMDDLYTAILPSQSKLQRPKDVHFQREGYDVLAKSVATSIQSQLPSSAQNQSK
jgi:acyl-CoA thioesterase-1